MCNCAVTAAADAYTYYVLAADAGLERLQDKIVKLVSTVWTKRPFLKDTFEGGDVVDEHTGLLNEPINTLVAADVQTMKEVCIIVLGACACAHDSSCYFAMITPIHDEYSTRRYTTCGSQTRH